MFPIRQAKICVQTNTFELMQRNDNETRRLLSATLPLYFPILFATFTHITNLFIIGMITYLLFIPYTLLSVRSFRSTKYAVFYVFVVGELARIEGWSVVSFAVIVLAAFLVGELWFSQLQWQRTHPRVL
jgi:hypothetical protein